MEQESMERNGSKFVHNGSLPGGSALKNLAAEGTESAEACLEFESGSALLVISAAQHRICCAKRCEMLKDSFRVSS